MATLRTYLPVLGAIPPRNVTRGEVTPGALVDPAARRIRYLRVSVTDRCNFACTYCRPDDVTHEPRAQVLSFEEIERVVHVFAKLGVRKIRLTGGEPTVRKGIVDLVARVARIPGIEQVVMTTNGHLLEALAAPLAAAGLAGVNISLDTLDRARFAELTGRDELASVIAGFEAAARANLRVQLNAVALNGVNDHELAALSQFAWDHGATPRFIEHMPMSAGALYESDALLSAAAIRARLTSQLGALAPIAPATADAGPARYWAIAGHGTVGIISAMTEHFCGDCNRLRLTATGDLHACLGHDDAVPLRDVMRAGASDADLSATIAGAVSGKRVGHEFAPSGVGGPQKHMIALGG